VAGTRDKGTKHVGHIQPKAADTTPTTFDDQKIWGVVGQMDGRVDGEAVDMQPQGSGRTRGCRGS
jgi:hypothetical protein